jgi:LPS sulfotransferase NodH
VYYSGFMVVLFAATNDRKRIWRHYMSKHGVQFCFVNYLWCLADLLTAYLHTDRYLIMI